MTHWIRKQPPSKEMQPTRSTFIYQNSFASRVLVQFLPWELVMFIVLNWKLYNKHPILSAAVQEERKLLYNKSWLIDNISYVYMGIERIFEKVYFSDPSKSRFTYQKMYNCDRLKDLVTVFGKRISENKCGYDALMIDVKEKMLDWGQEHMSEERLNHFLDTTKRLFLRLQYLNKLERKTRYKGLFTVVLPTEAIVANDGVTSDNHHYDTIKPGTILRPIGLRTISLNELRSIISDRVFKEKDKDVRFRKVTRCNDDVEFWVDDDHLDQHGTVFSDRDTVARVLF